MSEARHTPGPWLLNPDDRPWALGHIWGGLNRSEWVASVHLEPEQSAANARLIVAAPELLKALRAILVRPDGCPMCDEGKLRPGAAKHWPECGYPMAAAAIAKTEGRS